MMERFHNGEKLNDYEMELLAQEKQEMLKQPTQGISVGSQVGRQPKNPIEAMLNPPKQNVGRPGNIADMFVGDRRQPVGIASQLASAGLNQAIPGMATQNHLINQAVGIAAKTGSMNVPFM
jgi:hypothetical protein